ncbi:hypothetical protein FC831_17065 [Clostridium botulinum]|nr:hypothetical protein [Clostridium botulinum]
MLIDIDKIIIKDRIRKDYGNIEELANDIKENGLINPPVVTERNGQLILIAGERRTRACKYLKYPQIEVRVMPVKDALHQLKLEISENENRKDFSFSEKMQWAEQLKEEYGKIAKENQLSRLKNQLSFYQQKSNDKIDTNKQIADDLDMGKETFRKSQFIKENADEDIIKQLDDGKLTINKAYNTLKDKLKQQEQENQELKQALEQEKSKPKEKEYIEKVVEIDNTDYTVVNKLNKTQKELEDKITERDRLKEKLDIMTERAEIYEENSNEYKELQRQIEILGKEKDDISRAVSSGTELAGLVYQIESFLKNELCPITYSRAILDMSSNETVMKNLQEIIEVVEKWCGNMRGYLPKNQQNIIIDVEEN